LSEYQLGKLSNADKFFSIDASMTSLLFPGAQIPSAAGVSYVDIVFVRNIYLIKS